MEREGKGERGIAGDERFEISEESCLTVSIWKRLVVDMGRS